MTNSQIRDECASAIHACQGRRSRDVVSIGGELARARKTFEAERPFLAWCRERLDIGRRSVFNYLAAWRTWGDKPEGMLERFTLRGLYALSGRDVPRRAIDKAVLLAMKGVRIDGAKAAELIGKRSSEPEKCNCCTATSTSESTTYDRSPRGAEMHGAKASPSTAPRVRSEPRQKHDRESVRTPASSGSSGACAGEPPATTTPLRGDEERQNHDDEPELPKLRPFADLPELPDDLADAVESFKLAVVRHRISGWSSVAPDDVLTALDCLRGLVLAPNEGAKK